MANQISILNQHIQPDGSFYVSGVFWLTTPTSNVVPNPNFNSVVPFVDNSTLTSLKYGALVEQTFNTGLFASGTTSAQVQAAIQAQFNDAQTQLNNTESALAGLVGTTFDGTNWNTTNVFGNLQKTQMSAGHTQRFANWSVWKKCQTTKNGQFQFDDDGYVYTIWFYDGPEVHICNIWKTTVPSGIIASGYTQAQNDADKSDFESNYKPLANGVILPRAADGRPNMAPNSFPMWSNLYFFGRGDDDGYGIAKGPYFQASSDVVGDTVVQFHLTDLTYIIGGIINYTGAQIGDTVSYVVVAPPTPVGSGTQAVNLVNVGPGNILIPSPTADGYLIDLTTAIPVQNVTNTGYWNWDMAKTGKGTITPNYNGNGGWDLYDFEINLGNVAAECPMVGDNMRIEIMVESVTSMMVLPQWQHICTVHNGGHAGLRVCWIACGARLNTI